jgi:hypothetical protein
MLIRITGMTDTIRTHSISIEGLVLDSLDFQPLRGANIFAITNTGPKGATADSTGAFSLTGLASSDTLRFSYVGYWPKKLPISMILKDGHQNLRFEKQVAAS